MMPCSNNAAGYYHYATGSNESYEETLPKVKAAIRICQTVGYFGLPKLKILP